MKKINQNQLRAVYALLGDNGLREEKEAVVNGFTGGRTTSVSKMSSAEAASLIGHLKSLNKTHASAEKMRNKILSHAHELGWTTNGKVMMERVNNWCTKYGHAHKRLDDYTYAELPTLVTQFEELLKSHLKTV